MTSHRACRVREASARALLSCCGCNVGAGGCNSARGVVMVLLTVEIVVSVNAGSDNAFAAQV